MQIKEIEIKNFRSIKEITVRPNAGLNAFIGENSVGKSNIFSAINWLLGKTWPTFNQTTLNDHFDGKNENKIYIRILFDDGIEFILDESQEYNFNVFNKGTRQKGSNNEFREKYSIAHLGTEREIVDYLPSNRWSLIGRILQSVNDQFSNESMNHLKSGEVIRKTAYLEECLTFIKENILFTVLDEKGENIMNKFVDILQNETASHLNRRKEEFLVDFNLYDPWNFYKTLQILVKEENGLTFQASQLGMGVQASISIAVLKAYAELNLKNKPCIFIDEPELFLHPQAQRNFYKILRKLSESKTDPETGEIIQGTQIFYNTHSPDFLNAGNFNEIFLVRKNLEKGTHYFNGKLDDFCIDLKKRTGIESTVEDFLLHMKNAYDETGDSQKANEAFFAKKVVLVEGQTETWVLPYFFDLCGFDCIKEGITIVRCGCKNEIDRFFRLYSEFGIPCYVIFDGDKHLETTEEKDANIKKNKAIFQILGISDKDYPDNNVHENFLGFEGDFGTNLGVDLAKDDKSLDVYRKVKDKIKTPGTVPNWVSDLITKIKGLSSTQSVLLKE